MTQMAEKIPLSGEVRRIIFEHPDYITLGKRVTLIGCKVNYFLFYSQISLAFSMLKSLKSYSTTASILSGIMVFAKHV